MLQSLRDNLKGAIAVIIVGLMIIPFALFGVDSLFLQDSSAGQAAEVDGRPISEADLSRAVRNQKQQLLERYGEQAPVELLSDENLRQPVLERLIQREIVQQSADRGGMTVADAHLDQLIVMSPQFQQAGKFNPELYTQLLRMSGFTPASYKRLLQQDIIVRQHTSGVSDSAFVTQADVNALIALSQQTRTFSYLVLPQAQVLESLTVSEAEMQSFYEANQAQFMSTEQVSIEYIELSLNELADEIDVSDAAIEAQYEANLKAFKGEVLRQAAHILIEDGEDQSRIDEVQEKLNAGEDFAVLAAAYSDDFGSKDMGGDLGVTDGSTFPEAFEAVLAGLSVGAVSGPIETDAGIHFIKLLSERQAQAPTLAESREDIRAEIALAEAESRFVETLEALPDATYNATDLVAAADSLGLTAKVSEPFGRSGGDGVAANNQVLALAFSPEILQERRVTDLIELSDDHVMVFRIAAHQPSAVKDYAEVMEDIRQQLLAAKASQALSEQADDLLAELKGGSELESLAQAHQLEWQAAIDVNRVNPAYDRDLLSFVFSLGKPAVEAAIFDRVALTTGDHAVVQLSSVKAGALPDMPPEQRANLQKTVDQQQGAAELSLFEAEKRQAADITIY